MKIWDLTIITFALSVVGIIISGYVFGQEYHDFNVWTALLIYTIPALVLSIANGYSLISVQKLTKNNILRIGIGLIPTFVLIGLLIWKEGPLKYIATFGLIPILITFLVWILKNPIYNKKTNA